MKKRILGQFFTKKNIWLKPQVIEFIKESGCDIAYDPFAGSGDMLEAMRGLGFKKNVGLDIDSSHRYKTNDSLISIPKLKKALIVTNPPYLTNYSAKRKNIYDNVAKYFKMTHYSDLYLLALEKMLEAQDFVLAIVPETFINSNFKHFGRLVSISILEENCFDDTENPVCVVCFNGKYKTLDKIKIYKNDNFIDNLDNLERQRLRPTKKINLVFNKKEGIIALRAVDGTDPKTKISFDYKENLKYNLSGIKHSSRLITIIDMQLKEELLSDYIYHCNELLEGYRKSTHDILLSPFKGNNRAGNRRRRLDYETARAIMEKAFAKIEGQHNGQYKLI
jgi:hypothetical protein